MNKILISIICYIPLFLSLQGQSLSVSNLTDKVLITSNEALDNRYILQASKNLNIWIDITNDFGGSYFSKIDGNSRFFRLSHWNGDLPNKKIMILGDSTATDGNGWGSGIYTNINDNAVIINNAFSWTSSKVFLSSVLKDKMLREVPDVVLVQFGYMDDEPLYLGRGTTIEEYESNMRIIINMIRDFGGVPIILTPNNTRYWDINGNLIPSQKNRCDILKKLCIEYNLYMIDMNGLTYRLYSELGKDGCEFIDPVPGDKVHISPQGATIVSRLVVESFPTNLWYCLSINMLN